MVGRPLSGAELTIYPDQFEPVAVVGGKTDDQGQTTITITHHELPGGKRPRVYFLVKAPPALVTTHYGAYVQGDSTVVPKKSRQINDGDEIDLDVIPYAERGTYYVSVISAVLAQASGRDVDLEKELNLDPATFKLAVNDWAVRFTENRPAVAIDAAGTRVLAGLSDAGQVMQITIAPPAAGVSCS